MRDLQELGLQTCGRDVLPPPTAQQIALVEEIIGRPLPQSYLTFLRFCNGCAPRLDYFTVENEWGEHGYLVAAFYHISAKTVDTDDSSEVVWQYINGDPEIPDEIVPIALTPFGDSIYLDLTELGDGRVVLEQHGLPEWASGTLPANTDLVIYVAPSFEAFLDLLITMPEEE